MIFFSHGSRMRILHLTFALVEVLCHINLILLHDVNSRCRLLLCNHVLVKRHGLIRFKAIVVTSMKFLEPQNTLLLPNCILKRGRDVDTIPIKRFFYRSSSRKQALYEHQPVPLFNSSSPNISMPILRTVLYKFPVVLMIRICLTRKSFFSLADQFSFSLMISVFDSAVLLWEEFNIWSLLGIKGLSLIACSIVIQTYWY